MDTSFWHENWERNDIGFHVENANPLLVKFFDALSLGKGSRVFVPLCGKTRDIAWLLVHGYSVAGVELSKLAIDQLFLDLGLALPENMRSAYAAHLSTISHQAPQLLISYAYQQDLMEGPPFSIGHAEIHQHYGDSDEVTLIDTVEVAGGLKGIIPSTERVWLLK